MDGPYDAEGWRKLRDAWNRYARTRYQWNEDTPVMCIGCGKIMVHAVTLHAACWVCGKESQYKAISLPELEAAYHLGGNTAVVQIILATAGRILSGQAP